MRTEIRPRAKCRPDAAAAHLQIGGLNGNCAATAETTIYARVPVEHQPEIRDWA